MTVRESEQPFLTPLCNLVIGAASNFAAHTPVRGCRDVLGSLAAHRRQLTNSFASHCAKHAYAEIEVPVLERASLYSAALGRTSDVVSAETFFVAACDPPVVLRPEGTAGVARALAAAGLVKRATAHGTRVWYSGTMFRRERPQRGRWRQFVQMGVECIGDGGVSADVEVIGMADGYLRKVAGRHDVKLRVNTLGTKADRDLYNSALQGWLKERYWAMSALSRERFDAGNCMRILDSKLVEDMDALAGAPPLQEFVSLAERERFAELQELLREDGVQFEVDERLVRGLDYYTSTAFEFDGRGGRAVCAGGRYMDVVGASGVGFAIGLDRIEDEALMESSSGVEAYERELEGGVAVIAHAKDAARSSSEVGKVCRRLVRDLREVGVKAIARLEGTKLSKAVSRAIKHGADVVLVIGARDLEAGCAQMKIVSKGEAPEASVPVEVELRSVVNEVRKQVIC